MRLSRRTNSKRPEITTALCTAPRPATLLTAIVIRLDRTWTAPGIPDIPGAAAHVYAPPVSCHGLVTA